MQKKEERKKETELTLSTCLVQVLVLLKWLKSYIRSYNSCQEFELKDVNCFTKAQTLDVKLPI